MANKHFKTLFCVTFYLCWVTGGILAQTTLQFPFLPGRINPGTDLQQTTNGDFLMSSYFPGPVLTAGGNANLSRFNVRNGVVWSKDFSFSMFSGGSYVADWPSESAIVLTAFVLDTLYNKVLVKLDQQGNILWSKRFGKPQDVSSVSIFNGKALARPLADGTILLAGGATGLFSNVGNNDLFVSKINADGNIIWAKNLCFSCLGDVDATLGNIISTSDGGFLLTGSVERNNNQNQEDVLLVKLSGNGNLQWARALNSPGSFLANDDQGLEVKELPNGHFVVVGNVKNFLDNLSDGLILEIAATGNYLSSAFVKIANSDHNVILPHFEVRGNNSIVVTGSSSQDTLINVAVQRNFLAQIRLDGSIDWQHSWYDETLLGFGTAGNALVRQAAGGYAYLINDHENFDQLNPVLLLTDDSGQTGCEEAIFLSTQTSNNFTASNLPLSLQDLTYSENFPPTAVNFNGLAIDLPYPDLGPDQSICPPINIVLDPKINAAEEYLWNTGATTSTIQATQAGQYRVTIFDNTFCFSAADTVEITTANQLPSVIIRLDTLGFCKNGFAVLTAITLDADTLRWLSGQSTDTIQISQNGTYSLEASNSCGNSTALLEVQLTACDSAEIICPLLVPNAFSPNEDGVNDVFIPIGECQGQQDYLFQVYGRWGNLVFESKNPNEGWKGDTKGKPASSDVYVWVLRYTDPIQNDISMQGDVTLLR